MKVALYIGLTIAFPVILYQMVAFVGPGLTRREKRFLLKSLPSVTMLFLLGVAFELPELMWLLAKLGIASPRWQAAIWRYAVVLILVISAIITPPPDPPT